MNQQDFDKAVKMLPSPAEIGTDIYIVHSFNADCDFVFQKEQLRVTPNGGALVMWVLKEIEFYDNNMYEHQK